MLHCAITSYNARQPMIPNRRRMGHSLEIVFTLYDEEKNYEKYTYDEDVSHSNPLKTRSSCLYP